MDDAVRAYIDAIDPRHRPLFDRVHGLIMAAHPEGNVVISYKMPTYRVGARRLYAGAWKHGVSLYGWPQGHDAGSPPGIPRSGPARERSGCGPRTRPE